MNRVVYQEPTLVISQQSPGPRTISVDERRYFLHFPYTIFAAVKREADYLLLVFGSKDPLRYAHQMVAIMPLPNTYRNGMVCLTQSDGHKFRNIKEYNAWALHRFFMADFQMGEVREDCRWRGEEGKRWRQAKDYKELYYPQSYQAPFSYFMGTVDVELITPDFYHEEIERRAYFMWLDAGQPPDQNQHFWNKAEQEITWKFQS